MLKRRVRFKISPVFVTSVRPSSNAVDSEYVDRPNYPPILPPEELESEYVAKKKWHEKISKLPTYEQKVSP